MPSPDLTADRVTRAEIHRRALRAAAAVASLSVGPWLSGCEESAPVPPLGAADAGGESDVATGGGPDSNAQLGTDAAAVDAAVDLASPDLTSSDVAGADVPEGDSPVGDVQTADVLAADATQTDVVLGDAAEGDAVGAKPNCAALQLDIGPCCDLLSAWCGAAFGAAGQQAIQDCTYGPNYDGSTGCIPWGPPAPPAFLAKWTHDPVGYA